MKLLYFDLETTGVLFWKNGIHQISGMLEIDGQIVDRFNWKVKPVEGAIIENEALAVAGITLADLETYMPMRECYAKLIALLSAHIDKFDKKDKAYLVGYNSASFDNPFLRAFFVQNGDNYFGSWFWSCPIDVMVLAGQRLMNDRPNMTDFKLNTVAKHLGVVVDETRLHDAQYDIELTRDVYKIVI